MPHLAGPQHAVRLSVISNAVAAHRRRPDELVGLPDVGDVVHDGEVGVDAAGHHRVPAPADAVDLTLDLRGEEQHDRTSARHRVHGPSLAKSAPIRDVDVRRRPARSRRRRGPPAPDVGAGRARRAGINPIRISCPNTQHPAQNPNTDSRTANAARTATSASASARRPEGDTGDRGGRGQYEADRLGEPLRRPRHQPRRAQPRRDDPCGQLAERAQPRPGEDAGEEAERQHHGQPQRSGQERQRARRSATPPATTRAAFSLTGLGKPMNPDRTSRDYRSNRGCGQPRSGMSTATPKSVSS